MTGIIVSVGVTVDSYVVYFERLKDEVRTGQDRALVARPGFRRAFRTIVAADLVSLIGAVVLYVLATGSVRGFAFFLGLSTLLDLLLAYMLHAPDRVGARRAARSSCACPGVGIAAGARRRRRCGVTATLDRRRRRRPKTSPASPAGTGPSDFYHERTNFQFIKHSPPLADPLGHVHRARASCCAVRPRPQPRHRLRGRHVVAGRDGRRQDREGRRRPRRPRPLGFADAKVSDPRRASSGQSVRVQAQVVDDPIADDPGGARRRTAASTTPTCSSAATATAAARSRSPRSKA